MDWILVAQDKVQRILFLKYIFTSRIEDYEDNGDDDVQLT
jgi:hypothetical protein